MTVTSNVHYNSFCFIRHLRNFLVLHITYPDTPPVFDVANFPVSDIHFTGGVLPF